MTGGRVLYLQGFDVLMYGDTLVEAWRGTFLGEPSSRAHGSADVFHSHFSHRWNAAALGIAGEQHGCPESCCRCMNTLV